MPEIKQEAFDLSKYAVKRTTTPAQPNPAIVSTNPAEQALSPLQKKLQAQTAQPSGMILDNDAIEKAAADASEIRANYDTDESRESLSAYMKEQDDFVLKRAHVVMLKPMHNEVDQVRIIDEIRNMVSLKPDGTPSFNLTDAEGNPIHYEWVRPRTKDDPAFDSGVSDEDIINGTSASSDADADIDDEEDVAAVEDSGETDNDKKKKKVISIIIDKTGYGSSVVLNEDERKKVVEAHEIRLTEIEEIDLATITVRRPTESYLGKVSEAHISKHAARMIFPGSGYSAEFAAMSYGEMSDIALNLNALTQDRYRKRLTTIYNKLKNPSCGKFESFEEFLKNTAYTDIPLATYALLVASYPEVQKIPLTCTNKLKDADGKETDKICGKSYDWTYQTRSILDLSRADEVFCEKMQELSVAHPSQYKSIYENSPVHKAKRIRLPQSGIIVEMGIISAYEFLNNYVPLTDDDIFHEAFGEDENDAYRLTSSLLLCISGIYVPNRDSVDTNGNVAYDEYRGYKDIVDVLMTIAPDEFRILFSLASEFTKRYTAFFHFSDVTCPHCGTKTKSMNVPIDDLLFQVYRQLLGTPVDAKNMQLV